MSIFAWLVLGLAAGYIGSKVVNNHGEGIIGDIVVGVIGAAIGGFLFRSYGSSGITGLNVWSLLVAIAGSVALLVPFYVIRHTRAYRKRIGSR